MIPAVSDILFCNSILDKLIERLVRSNVHNITSNTNIILNDSTGLFQTALGIVTPEAITEARIMECARDVYDESNVLLTAMRLSGAPYSFIQETFEKMPNNT